MEVLGNLKIQKTTNTLLDMRNATGTYSTSNTIDLTYAYSSNGINRSSFLMTGRNNTESYKWRTGTISDNQWGNSGEYRIDELHSSSWESRINIKSISGNVGIGTDAPDTKLHVEGQIKITGGVPGTNKILTSDATGLATWETVNAVGLVGATGADGSAGADGTDGGQGIKGDKGDTGNAGPAGPATDTNYYLDSATMNGNTLELGRNGGLSDLTVDLDQFLDDTNLWSENGANIYRNSNVGIGTATPLTDLHVGGSTIVDTQAWVKNNLIIGQFNNSANIVEIWNEDVSSLRVGSANDIAAFGTQIILQRQRGTFNSSTACNVGDTIGRIIFKSTDNSKYVELSSTHTTTGYDFKIRAETNTDDFYIKGGVGNVGLNTDDPTERLDVNGKIRMRTGAVNGYIPVADSSGVMTWTPPSSVFNDTNTNYYLNSASIAGNTLTLGVNGTSNVSVNLNWTQNGNNLYNANSGNVGVNTSTPTSHLHVDGSVAKALQWGGVQNYTITDDDYTIIAQATYNVTLPNPDNNRGRVIVVKMNGSGTVSVCVANPTGVNGQVIDTSYTFINLTGVGSAITLQAEGSQGKWHIISCCGTHEKKTHTPGVGVTYPVGGLPPAFPSTSN